MDATRSERRCPEATYKSLTSLPVEIISIITAHLDLEELLDLSLTCRALSYIIHDNATCRRALNNVKYSAEYHVAHDSGDFARGLRRLVKRRDAVRNARPYLVAVIAVADDFLYANGVICYSFYRTHLRVLQLEDGTTHREMEVNIQELLQANVKGYQKLDDCYCRPLHFADGFVSCLFRQRLHDIITSWLVVWQLSSGQVQATHQLEHTAGLFVRNDKDYLYFGVRSERPYNDQLRWALWCIDLETGRCDPDKLVLANMVGDLVGSTLCFEIFHGYFYGISSDAELEHVSNKWNSFYYAFRFQLGSHQQIEVLPQRLAWRRQPTEGPIDDRWSVLQLVQDESSGKLYIYESRREFCPAASQTQRTCYRKELDFPPLVPGGEQRTTSTQVDEWDSETHDEVRQENDLHREDAGSSTLSTNFAFTNTAVHSYNPSCRSFVDLVSDPYTMMSGRSRIRLRVQARPKNGDSRAREATDQPSTAPSYIADHADSDSSVLLWPPAQDSERQHNTPSLDRLYKILHPQPQFETMEWSGDDRFLVYAARGEDDDDSSNEGNRAIVLISFDPGLRLPGLPGFPGESGAIPERRPGNEASETISLSASDHARGKHSATSLDPPNGEVGPSKDYGSKDGPSLDATALFPTKQPFYQLLADHTGALLGFHFAQ